MNKFEIEAQMTRPVQDWLQGQGLRVKSEFRLPWGICDLMAVSLVNAHLDRRIEQGQGRAIGSVLRANMLMKIPDETRANGVSRSRLQKTYGSSVDPELIDRELQVLLDRGFVSSSRNGSFKKINGWMPLHDRMVAVELKLSRVGDALHQAVRNQPAVDESYVALPIEAANRVANSSKAIEFIRRGVGLIGVTADSCAVLLQATTKNSTKNKAIQLLCADRFLTDYLKGTRA